MHGNYVDGQSAVGVGSNSIVDVHVVEKVEVRGRGGGGGGGSTGRDWIFIAPQPN